MLPKVFLRVPLISFASLRLCASYFFGRSRRLTDLRLGLLFDFGSELTNRGIWRIASVWSNELTQRRKDAKNCHWRCHAFGRRLLPGFRALGGLLDPHEALAERVDAAGDFLSRLLHPA